MAERFRAHGVIPNRLESIRKLILVPTKAGDRVKTDRRDAEKLARCYRAGEHSKYLVACL